MPMPMPGSPSGGGFPPTPGVVVQYEAQISGLLSKSCPFPRARETKKNQTRYEIERGTIGPRCPDWSGPRWVDCPPTVIGLWVWFAGPFPASENIRCGYDQSSSRSRIKL